MPSPFVITQGADGRGHVREPSRAPWKPEFEGVVPGEIFTSFPTPDAAFTALRIAAELTEAALALACFRAAHDEDLPQ